MKKLRNKDLLKRALVGRKAPKGLKNSDLYNQYLETSRALEKQEVHRKRSKLKDDLHKFTLSEDFESDNKFSHKKDLYSTKEYIY